MSYIGKIHGQHQSEVALRLDGPILRKTSLELIENGASRPAVESTVKQAEAFLAMVVKAYEHEVAKGEVGASGSGKASQTLPQCTTGLLYGRIQSGKTQGMVLSTALALDNGFRVVVVLTSDNVKLVEQTAKRFQAALTTTITHSSSNFGGFEADLDHIKKELANTGLVVVCSKNSKHLENVTTLLAEVGAGNYPAVIFDDEADQASVDTNNRKRSQQREKGVPERQRIGPSRINNHILDGILETLRHNVFIQVTATPYCLFLQNTDDPMRPSFTFLLEPGNGYVGGEFFFDPLRDCEDPREAGALRFVSEEESNFFQEKPSQEPPPGLMDSIFSFIVGVGVQALETTNDANKPKNYLCHVSHKKDEHTFAADLIRSGLEKILSGLRTENKEDSRWFHGKFDIAYSDLLKTQSNLPTKERILEELTILLPTRKIHVVNADNSEAAMGKINFLVGGNILGRGLTIENLLVTYYLRDPRISQMDTMYQHARMFGYRNSIKGTTRVYLPVSLALRFFGIHDSEMSLRRFIRENGAENVHVKFLGSGLRATRPNVLDISAVSGITPGDTIYPMGTPTAHRNKIPEVNKAIHEHLAEMQSHFTKLPKGKGEICKVDMSRLLMLLKMVENYKYDETGRWNIQSLGQIILSLGENLGRNPYIFKRDMAREKKRFFTSGAATGAELGYLKGLDHLTLMLFYDEGKKLDIGIPFYFPTIVFPSSDTVPFIVYNHED